MLLFLYYGLKVIICSGVLYGYYWLALRNNRFHHWNRWYLLSSVLLSLGLPLLQIPLLYHPEQPNAIAYSVQILSTPDIYFATQKPQSFRLTANFVSFAAYLLVALGLLFLFFKNLRTIQLLKRKYSSQTVDGVQFYNTTEPGTPFSFFRNIFWNNRIDPQSAKGRQMLLHEMAHVTEHHSVDKVLLQLSLVIAFWNPFLYFIKKELSVVHEFIADQKAAADNDKLQYASLLLMKAMGSEQFVLGNPFFHSQLKRRLSMLTTSKNPRFSYIRRLLVLPLAALSLVLFSFRYKEIKKKEAAKALQQQWIAEDGFDSDSTRTKYYFKLDKSYKGSTVESIVPSTDLQTAIVKTADGKTYSLNRMQAATELGFVMSDSGFVAPPGATLVLPSQEVKATELRFLMNDSDFAAPPGVMLVLPSQEVKLVMGAAIKYKVENGQPVMDRIEVDTTSVGMNRVADENKNIASGSLQVASSGIPDSSGKPLSLLNDLKADFNELNSIEFWNQKPGEPGSYTKALTILDGFRINFTQLKELNLQNIKTINVLKGKEAIGKYGDDGKNGVLEIITNQKNTLPENVLYLLDGIESTKEKVQAIHPANIKEMSVWKGEEAIKKYGNKGQNGVVEVVTTLARNEVTFDNEVLPNKVKLDSVVIGYRKQPATVGAALSQQAPLPTLNEIAVVEHPLKNERYEMVFTKVEEPATFPGGPDGWNRYLLRQLQYPEGAVKAKTQGTVRVQIIVDKNGNITELKALDNPGNGLAEEAVRVLAKGPKWNPAKQNRKAVTYRFIQPVVFSLP